jgi:hydroxymethylbilane synthase
MTVLRLATRRSALALAQSRQVARILQDLVNGLQVEEVQVVTQGDRVLDRALSEVGGKGLFVREIEEALLDGRADLAVHSMKDLPAQMAAGLALAAVPKRESPWDALVTAAGVGLDALPHGARLGTSSLRRSRTVKAARPDLEVLLLRGNVDTRLRRLEAGDFDAIILAEAGLRRLGLSPARVLLEGVMVPAVAQGALALQTRADDPAARAVVGLLHDEVTALETEAERAVLGALSGDCGTPLGALARLDRTTGVMRLEGYYAHPTGDAQARRTESAPVRDAAEARQLGVRVGAALRSAVGD